MQVRSCIILIDNTYAMHIGDDDYESETFNITIPAGEINVPFNISIIDDNTLEANESFSLTIDSSSLPSRVLLQPDCMLTVTIVDDDDSEFYCRIHTYSKSYNVIQLLC